MKLKLFSLQFGKRCNEYEWSAKFRSDCDKLPEKKKTKPRLDLCKFYSDFVRFFQLKHTNTWSFNLVPRISPGNEVAEAPLHTCEIASSYCSAKWLVSVWSLARSLWIKLFLQAASLQLRLIRFMLLAEDKRLPLISVNMEESTSQAPLLSQVKNSILEGRLEEASRL